MRRRKRIWRIPRVWYVVAAVLVVGSCIGGRAMVKTVLYIPGARPIPDDPPGATVAVDYKTEDGVTLRGARAPAKESAGPVVVFFHGNGGSAASFLETAQMLADRWEVDIFLAEYRGYGGLMGEPSEDGLYADGRAAVRAARGDGGAPVVLVGYSLGAAVAVQLAAEGLAAAIILLGGFTSVEDVARDFVKRPETRHYIDKRLGKASFLVTPASWILHSPLAGLLISDEYDSAAKIDRVQVPVYVVHGTADRVVPIAMGRTLAERAPQGKLFEVTGGTHGVLFSQQADAAFAEAKALLTPDP